MSRRLHEYSDVSVLLYSGSSCHSRYCLRSWNADSLYRRDVFSPEGFLGRLSAHFPAVSLLCYTTALAVSPLYYITNVH